MNKSVEETLKKIDEFFDEKERPENWRAKELISSMCCDTPVKQAVHCINFLRAGGTKKEFLTHLANVVASPEIVIVAAPLYSVLPRVKELNRYGVDFNKGNVVEAFRLDASQTSRFVMYLSSENTEGIDWFKNIVELIFKDVDGDKGLPFIERGILLGYLIHRVLEGAGIIKAEEVT